MNASIQNSTANSELSALSGRCQGIVGRERYHDTETRGGGDGEERKVEHQETRGSGDKESKGRETKRWGDKRSKWERNFLL